MSLPSQIRRSVAVAAGSVSSWSRVRDPRPAAPGIRTLAGNRWAVLISPLILLGVWTALSASGAFPRQIVVPPEVIWQAARDMWASGELPAHLAGSLSRLFVGYAIGAGIGVALGALMGVSKQAEAYLMPSFQLLRQLPTVALIPAFIMLFGVGETVKLVLVAKATALPVGFATVQGIKGIPRSYFDVGRLYKAPRLALLFKVVLPAAVPPVITGLRIALARSWMVLVGAELLVADSGLGQMMEWGRQTFRIDIVLVGVVLTGLIGFLLDKGFRLGERALAPAGRR